MYLIVETTDMMELGWMSYFEEYLLECTNSALELHVVSALFSLGHTTAAAKR